MKKIFMLTVVFTMMAYGQNEQSSCIDGCDFDAIISSIEECNYLNIDSKAEIKDVRIHINKTDKSINFIFESKLSDYSTFKDDTFTLNFGSGEGVYERQENSCCGYSSIGDTRTGTYNFSLSEIDAEPQAKGLEVVGEKVDDILANIDGYTEYRAREKNYLWNVFKCSQGIINYLQ